MIITWIVMDVLAYPRLPRKRRKTPSKFLTRMRQTKRREVTKTLAYLSILLQTLLQLAA
jgi:hypothetical protein